MKILTENRVKETGNWIHTLLIDPQKAVWWLRQGLAKKQETKKKKKILACFRPETELPSSNDNKCITPKFGLQWVFWIQSKASPSLLNTHGKDVCGWVNFTCYTCLLTNIGIIQRRLVGNELLKNILVKRFSDNVNYLVII